MNQKIYSHDLSELEKNLLQDRSTVKICEACGREFLKYNNRHGRTKFCNRIHYCICPICGKEFTVNLTNGINYIKKTCSKKCANEAKKLNMEATMIEKYGVSNAGQLEDHSEKTRQTCLEKYGAESFSASEEFKTKMKSVWANKTPEELEERLQKSIATNLERYGVENGSQSEHAKQKQIKTNRERYGVDWYRQTEECERQIRQTNKERYGDSIFFRTQYYRNKIHETSLEKYGVDHFTKSQEYKDHMKDVISDKYGVSTVLQTENARNKLKQVNQKKYGVNYSFERADIQEKCKNKIRELYGVEYGFQSPTIQKLADQGMIQKYGKCNPGEVESIRHKIIETSKSSERQSKYESTVMKNYGVKNPMQNRDLVIKQTQSAKNNITLDGTRVDSSYEKDVYNFCIRNGLKFETQIPIQYEYEGSSHTTFIDFKIEDILFEVKGSHLLNGCFDYDPNQVPISIKIDLYKKHNVVVITDRNVKDKFGKPNSLESNGLKYLNRCPEPFIGVDIELFQTPHFPFRKNRPELFYKVKVNHQRSSYEAFHDEKVRWEMILNRINYSGGFIDANQILTAMNITRQCKQPSWFSKSFAKSIIQKYVTTDIIVDCFAGWGTRYDAAIELHKTYIGIDFNEELVNWHQQKKRNIQYEDAKEFKFEDECSVFICPPYQDVEIYFDDQDSELTQCQWLEIVMKNVPNAREYIMVCKIVDPGWEKYIVDEKINKSHFGNNTEYILRITNEERNKLLDPR